MIRFENVSVTYDGASAPTLSHVDLSVPEGELVLVVGPTGSGKTTLLGTVNGHVPHFTGGTLTGRVSVDGRDTRTHKPRDLADVVGVVRQDPSSGFVADTVEDELAFGMEWLGVPPAVMRVRVEETLDLLGLAELRRRALSTLSGGQQQRVAIGSALTAHPRVLVLDEPTSALDPQGAEEVLAALQRLVHDLGMTVLMAEHRLERVVQYADQVLRLGTSAHEVQLGEPAAVLLDSPVAPPVVELGRLVHLTPVPLTVRDARRRTTALRERLATRMPPVRKLPAGPAGELLAQARGVSLAYGALVALRDVDLRLRRGEVVAVMGRNGAGKSSLLSCLVGLRTPQSGRVLIGDLPVHQARPQQLVHRVGLVPQQSADLLYAESVAAECRGSDRDSAVPAGTTRTVLERLEPGLADDLHPRDLSEGQRLCLALSVVLAAGPELVLLDEPTRGLDYTAKRRLVQILRELAGTGHGVVLATHDVELVAEVATRVVVIADGEIVADGPTASVVIGSPAFAPQVAKIMAPLPWLTVADVRATLEQAS